MSDIRLHNRNCPIAADSMGKLKVVTLPSGIEDDKMHPANKFLYELHLALSSSGRLQEPPTLRFFNCIRQYFADGCAVFMIDSQGNCHNWLGDDTLISWVTCELKARTTPDIAVPVSGYCRDNRTGYLVTSIYKQETVDVQPFLLVWREKRIFSSMDIFGLQLAVDMYQGHFANIDMSLATNELAFQSARIGALSALFETTAERKPPPEAKSRVLLECHFRDCLDVITEMAVICGSKGEPVWLNKPARAANTIFGILDAKEFHDYTWASQVVHPDDVRMVVEKIKSSIETNTTSMFPARLPVHQRSSKSSH